MSNVPWYKRVVRWGQTNITEKDPIRYDVEWWRKQWKRTGVQGVIINAGGIITYYPSKYELSYRSPFLGERDLFGEIVEAARKDGLCVLARMDSNRVDEKFYIEHPDWIAIDKDGKPYKDGDKYITCIHSPYYSEYLPAVLVEIGERYNVDGYTDNSYSGLLQNQISYSWFAKKKFKEDTGLDLPEACDWNDPIYHEWVRWGYQERTRIWDLNSRTVKEHFGEDCCWIGMINGDVAVQNTHFRDLVAISERAEIIMLDYQSRKNPYGFRQNKDAGKLLHELIGWDKLIPESTAMYQHADVAYRLSAKPKAESCFWTYSGMAGGIQPWWHYIGAYHDDRRLYETPVDIFQWHQANEKYLLNRKHIADVGVVYSPESIDFYGRDRKDVRYTYPFEGTLRALSEAGILYTLIHIDRIPSSADNLKALIFPNIGAMSDEQITKIREYAEAGGSVIFSGETAAYDVDGLRRDEYPFDELFGIKYLFSHHGSDVAAKYTWADYSQHTYARMKPSCKGTVDAPFSEAGKPVDRGPILKGFEATDILPFGGRLECAEVTSPDVAVLLTFVPCFPVYPPELSWMKYPDSGMPVLIERSTGKGGKAIFMFGDFDRLYCTHRIPDHGRLLRNVFRSVLSDEIISISAEGDVYIDPELYEQNSNYVLHLMNLTGTDKPVMNSFIPVSDVHLRICLRGRKLESVDLLVAGKNCDCKQNGDYAEFDIDKIDYHEVCVIRFR